jgi:small subunit ribosomal protein S9
MVNQNTTTKTNLKAKKDYLCAVGRRKEAVARVRFYPDQKGEIEVNGTRIEEVFPGEINNFYYMEPLRTCNVIGKHKITIKVSGSGKMAQIGAIVHGISRALVIYNEERYRPILKKRSFLTRDPRAKERRKAGRGGRARAKVSSPKR